MASRIEGDQSPGLIDPACITDVFVEGIGTIDRVAGTCLRVTLYATRDLGDGETERLVVARLVAPLNIVPRVLRQVISFMGGLPFLTDRAPDIVPN